MAYSHESALDFWYDFDQTFLFAATPQTQQLYAEVFGPDGFSFDRMVDRVRDCLGNPQRLQSELSGREAAIRELARAQDDVIRRHFPSNQDLQRAFEDFGQGTLFDGKPLSPGNPAPRRPTGRLIHMMDGSPDECVGYHRWHAFIRAAVAVGVDAQRWLFLNQLVGLAWAIYSELDPQVDALDNPPMRSDRLIALRTAWLAADTNALNGGFLTYSGAFPSNYGSRRAPSSSRVAYQNVQRLLMAVASNSNPNHGGTGRFWELPFERFLSVSFYGHRLIAAAGPSRGARSALIKALRGTLPGYPRMPMNRPPMADADINTIEAWIDSLPSLSS